MQCCFYNCFWAWPLGWFCFNLFQEMEYTADPSGIKGYMFGFSTNVVTLKEETFLYPFTSFLGEFGGSLGLFLGFSFLTIWDFFLSFLKIIFFKCQKNWFFWYSRYIIYKNIHKIQEMFIKSFIWNVEQINCN